MAKKQKIAAKERHSMEASAGKSTKAKAGTRAGVEDKRAESIRGLSAALRKFVLLPKAANLSKPCPCTLLSVSFSLETTEASSCESKRQREHAR
eukprot:5656765-Pleurochrysis_carterae.AAC.1